MVVKAFIDLLSDFKEDRMLASFKQIAHLIQIQLKSL